MIQYFAKLQGLVLMKIILGRILFEIENSVERLDLQKYIGIFAFHSVWLFFIFIILLL